MKTISDQLKGGVAKAEERRVRGYQAQLKGAINQCVDGAEAQLDITSARHIDFILDNYRKLLKERSGE